MESWGILLDQDKRRQAIEQKARRAAARAGLQIVEDAGLVEELTFMLEKPRAFLGAFPERYLELPPEVIRTAMRAHQRYLAVTDKKGRLAPRFVAFCEGWVERPALVREGNERVLEARLEDALFYWKEDLKKGIRGLASLLEGIVFIEGMGTMAQKAERMGRLLEFLARNETGLPSDGKLLRELPLLAKADLASEMVKDGKEFTALEGAIGAHYARRAGEPEEVVQAIEEHYLPEGPGDPVPRTLLGAALSLCDKVDNLCGCFLAGLIPTGSQDPHALRRQAVGAFRILELKPLADLEDLIHQALALYREQGLVCEEVGEEVSSRLYEFIRTRASSLLRDRGYPYDLVEAALAANWTRPRRCRLVLEALGKARPRESFERLLAGAKRVANILPRELRKGPLGLEEARAVLEGEGELPGGGRVALDLRKEPAEEGLRKALLQVLPELERRESQEDFSGVLEAISGLWPSIERFFEQVMVMCEDPSLKSSRLSLLGTLHGLFLRYADFSRIANTQ